MNTKLTDITTKVEKIKLEIYVRITSKDIKIKDWTRLPTKVTDIATNNKSREEQVIEL